MQLRQDQSFRSLPKPSDHEKGKKPVTGRPSTSRRLFVPSSEEWHQEYQVYSDCKDRLNDRRKERRPSLIPVQTKLDDRHLDVLGPKSSIHRRYDAIGLEETYESDYIPTSPGTTISYRSAGEDDQRKGGLGITSDRTTGRETQGHSARQLIYPQPSEPFCNDVPLADPTIRLLLQKVNRIEDTNLGKGQARTIHQPNPNF